MTRSAAERPPSRHFLRRAGLAVGAGAGATPVGFAVKYAKTAGRRTLSVSGSEMNMEYASA